MDDIESPPSNRRTRLAQAISATGLSVSQFWPHYFALGGLRSEPELGRYLDGTLDLSHAEVDVIAATLFEQTGAFVNDSHVDTPPGGPAVLEIDSAQIEAAIWVDGAGRASPTESSKDHWLARSLNVGCLVRVDRQPDTRWERHPSGDEVIHLVSGSLQVSTGSEDSPETIELAAGQTTVIAANTWHRHISIEPGAVLFVTPLLGTEQRPL